MNELPRIDRISAILPASLLIEWKHGGSDLIDLTGWIGTGGDILADLNEANVFSNVAVGDFGTAVEWPLAVEDCAIDAQHLNMIAREQARFGAEELSKWQHNTHLSNNEAADFLGLSLSTWKNYKTGAAIPARVKMLLRAVERDPIILHAHYRPRSTGRPKKSA